MTRDRLRVTALAAVGGLVACAAALVWVVVSPSDAAVATAVVVALAAVAAAVVAGVLLRGALDDLDALQGFLRSPDADTHASLSEDLRADTRPVLDRAARIESLSGQLDELAVRDPDTGVLTDRELDQRLLAEVDRIRRHGGELAVLFVELDGLDDLRDEHGAGAVTELQRGVAVVLDTTARPSDIVGRTGDGFVVILPHATPEGAVAAGERFASTATATPIMTTLAGTRSVRVRVGVACFPGDASSPGDLLVAAREGIRVARREDRDVVRARA